MNNVHNVTVLVLSGSPRKDGNTAVLLEEFEKGAKNEGAAVEHLSLADYDIAPCVECLSCFKDGSCVIPDDMEEIYPRLVAADIVVLASPIFFYGVTGFAKAMIDRCQALWARKYVLHDPAQGKEGKKRKGFFISLGGTKGEKLFDGAILTAKYFFDAINAKYAGELLFRGIDAKGDILKRPDALADAYAAGGRLVREFRSKE